MTTDASTPIDASPTPEGAQADEVSQRKFVRVVERRANGLVAFEFSVGWPDLAAELVMPQDMFDDFCRQHRVEFLEGPAAPQLGDHRDDD